MNASASEAQPFTTVPARPIHPPTTISCVNFFLDTPAPYSYTSLARELPGVQGKTRLNILVMLTSLFHGKGAHHFQAEHTWPYSWLIVGTDPVAVDATGVRILDAKRKEHLGKEEPLSTPPKAHPGR